MKEGYTKFLIRTVDTDVVILAVYVVQKVQVRHLWVAFGTGKGFRYLAIHEIVNSLGPDKSRAMPMFHAFTGCDSVSFFFGKGKKTCWNVWRSLEGVTQSFISLLDSPEKITEPESTAVLERYVILIYDRTSAEVDVNIARKTMFSQRGKDISRIPPTKGTNVLASS